MTPKKVKGVKVEVLTLENISVGDIVPDLHGEDVEITDDLIEQMRRFEQESKKSAIYKNKITGTFLYFKFYEYNPQKKKEKKKPGRKPKKVDEDVNIEELEEEEIINEENMMLDAIEDYKAEFNVKKVNTNTKKFKAFYNEWKQV